jgi:hypothetical protein
LTNIATETGRPNGKVSGGPRAFDGSLSHRLNDIHFLLATALGALADHSVDRDPLSALIVVTPMILQIKTRLAMATLA